MTCVICYEENEHSIYKCSTCVLKICLKCHEKLKEDPCPNCRKRLMLVDIDGNFIYEYEGNEVDVNDFLDMKPKYLKSFKKEINMSVVDIIKQLKMKKINIHEDIFKYLKTIKYKFNLVVIITVSLMNIGEYVNYTFRHTDCMSICLTIGYISSSKTINMVKYDC